jgi:hypothetical protein
MDNWNLPPPSLTPWDKEFLGKCFAVMGAGIILMWLGGAFA